MMEYADTSSGELFAAANAVTKGRGDSGEFVRRAASYLGLGFHPDTPFVDYLDPDGATLFSPSVAKVLDEAMETATEEVDVFAVSLDAWKAAGLMAPHEESPQEWWDELAEENQARIMAEQSNASRLTKAVDGFLAVEGAEDKHEWEAAHEELMAAREAMFPKPPKPEPIPAVRTERDEWDGLAAVFTIAGMRVRVTVADRTTTDGNESALLTLAPEGGCDLDGEEPGVYYLVPRGEGRLSS